MRPAIGAPMLDEWGLVDDRYRRNGKHDPYYTEHERNAASDAMGPPEPKAA